jgi:Reverse transcriptase (RNA-dependent DNA polymerase)
MGLEMRQLDVKGAYLNGNLRENIYMVQPEGYEDSTDLVCHLRQTLYGLKQSGREWNHKIHNAVSSVGFSRLDADHCVYVRRDGKDFDIVAIWVDDAIITGMTAH